MAIASFQPGAPRASDIFSNGTFYDFGEIFAESPLPGTGCDVVINLFAPVSECDSPSSGRDSIFARVFETVAGELGIPTEIAEAVTGKQSIDDLLGDWLDDLLGAIGIEPAVIGSNQSYPDFDELLDILYGQDDPAGKVPAEPTAEIPVSNSGTPAAVTPNVNSALIRPVQAMDVLVEAIASRGLTSEGQQMTSARNQAGQTIAQTSAEMGEISTAAAHAQLAVATSMGGTIRAQTSTQSTLKEALSGINLLQAQSTELSAYANQQRALANQLDGISLQVSQEMRDGVFASGKSLQLLNEQVLQASQKDLAARASLRYEFAPAVRTFGAMR